IGKIEGRQKEVPDGSEKGLESLGRPTNDYFKNQYSKNDKAIGIISDGRDYSNVDFGENVGDNVMAAPLFSNPVTAIAGIVIIGYTFAPQDTKDKINQAVINGYEKIKKQIYRLLDVKDEKELTISIIKNQLLEQGIIADVTIDENTGKINIMYTLSPLPEDMKKEGTPPMPLPEEEKNPRIPPMDPPKEETEKEKREREERDRREQKEKNDEWQKPSGIPLPQEKPVTIYTITAEEAKEMYKGVQGKNKVVNLSKNLTKEQIENKKNKANSKILDEQLKNSNVPKPDYNCAAHHLVSDRTMPNATKALNDYGIDINSATNGVYLPTANADSSKVTTEAVHSGPNGSDYKEALEKSIPRIVKNMEDVGASYNEIQAALENELNNTRIKLLTGELKINNAELKEKK
ncbi:AHH domain-containing protein, partial [Fusobacterium simiae]|uniref:AHH domain-containing protein n=1 Tax=Fusobacterium simiae TaxID=855 RepID=UPI00234FE514